MNWEKITMATCNKDKTEPLSCYYRGHTLCLTANV